MNCWMDTDTHTHSLIHFHPLCRKIAFCSLTNGLIGVWFQSSQPLRPLHYPLKSTPFSLPSSLHFLSPHILLLHLSLFTPLFTISPLICASVYIYSLEFCVNDEHTPSCQSVYETVCVYSHSEDRVIIIYLHQITCALPHHQTNIKPSPTRVLFSPDGQGAFTFSISHTLSHKPAWMYTYTRAHFSLQGAAQSHTQLTLMINSWSLVMKWTHPNGVWSLQFSIVY